MKKVLLALAICMSCSAFAQILEVGSVNKIDLPENYKNAVIAGIAPAGDYILLTDATNQGLTKIDLATGEAQVITDAQGAGFNAQISEDGKTIIYRETTFNAKKLRYNSLKAINLATGQKSEIVKASRNLQAFYFEGNNAVSVNAGKMSVMSFGEGSKADKPVLYIKDTQLMMNTNGATITFSPNGTDCSYLWPSISPDGKKVLYYVAGQGAYVCDINGKNVTRIGLIRAAKWYDNNTIVGMNDKDNGEIVTSSSIVVSSLNGVSQTLTDASVIAMYPYTVADGSKIVFSTPEGEAYIINLNVK